MLGTNVFVAQSFCFLGREIQYALALLAQRNFHRSRNALTHGDARLDLFPDGFDRAMRAQKTVGERLILAQQSEQQVLCLDVRAAILARLVPCEKDYAPSLFCIAFKHGSPTVSWSRCPSTDGPRERYRGIAQRFCARRQFSAFQCQNTVGAPG